MNRQRFEQHLEEILRFWQRARDTESGGFHSFIDSSGRVHETSQKLLLIQGRLLYSYAEGMLRGWEFCASEASCLHEFIRDSLRTPEGWYASIRRGSFWPRGTLDTYTNLFAVIGLAKYAQATRRAEVLEQAWSLLRLIEDKTIDGDLAQSGLVGGWRDETVDDGHRRSRRKTHSGNVNLHYLEALGCLRDAGISEDLLPRVGKVREFFGRFILDRQRWITFDSFYGGYDKPFVDPGAHASMAHALEWVWFFRRFDGMALDEDVERGLLDAATERCLRDDGLFEDAYYLAEQRTAGGAVFWPQVEAAATLNVAAAVYGAPYDEALRRVVDYYFRKFVDSDGGVFSEIDRNGVVTDRLKGGFWKCDYHSVRMCVEILQRADGVLPKT